MPAAPRNTLIALLSSSLVGCVGGFAIGGGGGLDDFIDSIPEEDLACPVDPDCAIGGDCTLYECPDHWICEQLGEDGQRCLSPKPDYPDEGSWECHDEAGTTICVGDHYPDGGGGSVWNCEQAGDLVTCVRTNPDYPDGGGGSVWSCFFEGEFRICSTIPGDDGGWTCWDTDTGRECRRDRPDLPGDGGDWLCYDYEGETHCDGGPGVPDGGDWECVERGGEYYCVDRTPDYPDGGGGSGWSCRFTREFRECDFTDGGGDGGIPHTDCPPSDPTCGRSMCTDGVRGAVTLIDNLDGDDNGEIYVLGDGGRDESCATVRVDVTAYYTLYDAALAESCRRQLDEISYVTIENTCNADGNPVERNVGERFVIGDVDNTPDCGSDADCTSGSSCRMRSAGYCCVPTAPALVGTFLLVAGEDNRVCLHHVCPEVRAGLMTGAEPFITAGCDGSINSVHLRLDGSAFVCPDPSLEFPLGCGM